MRLQRVRQDWETSLSFFHFLIIIKEIRCETNWRRVEEDKECIRKCNCMVGGRVGEKTIRYNARSWCQRSGSLLSVSVRQTLCAHWLQRQFFWKKFWDPEATGNKLFHTPKFSIELQGWFSVPEPYSLLCGVFLPHCPHPGWWRSNPLRALVFWPQVAWRSGQSVWNGSYTSLWVVSLSLLLDIFSAFFFPLP